MAKRNKKYPDWYTKKMQNKDALSYNAYKEARKRLKKQGYWLNRQLTKKEFKEAALKSRSLDIDNNLDTRKTLVSDLAKEDIKLTKSQARKIAKNQNPDANRNEINKIAAQIRRGKNGLNAFKSSGNKEIDREKFEELVNLIAGEALQHEDYLAAEDIFY